MSGTAGGSGSAHRLIAVTPAHNEADHLPTLFAAMVAQTTRPDRWVVVDDGSQDETGPLAERLAAPHDFITVLRRPRPSGRQLTSKAHSVAAGYTAAIEACPDATLVASLDADVELPPHAFTHLLDRFDDDPGLGVAGGVYQEEVDGRTRIGRVRPTHVPGPLQVFRREVFDAIDGYQPLPDGGLDVVSTAKARMLGWRTIAFPELVYIHHRRMGTGGGRRPLSAHFHGGIRDRSLGATLPFMVVKSLRRLTDRPLVLGSMARLAGFLYASVTRRPSAVPAEVASFMRAEHRRRILPDRLRTVDPRPASAAPGGR